VPLVNPFDKNAIAKEGWAKEAVYEDIEELPNKTFRYRKWQFKVDMFPCEQCQTTEHVYLKSMPQGIYRACMYHRRTTGPMPTEERQKGGAIVQKARILEERMVQPPEALEIAIRLYMWGRRPWNISIPPPTEFSP